MAYSSDVKAKALELLALNKNDLKRTSEMCGVPEPTLARWARTPDKDATIVERLEDAVNQMFDNMPETFSPKDWAVAMGILMDKLILMKGGATSRTESITRTLDMIPESDRDAIIAEAERILAEH